MKNAAWLFWGLLGVQCLMPFSQLHPFAGIGLRLLAMAVMLLGLRALGESGGLRVGVVLAVPATVLLAAVPLHPTLATIAAGLVASLLFDAWLAARLLGWVLRERRATSGTVYLALVVYLLVGLVFSSLYMLAEIHQPGSIVGSVAPHGPLPLRPGDTLYFSIAVLTTVGFGEITPASLLARTLVSLEATFGVLYPCVLIARLVGLYERD